MSLGNIQIVLVRTTHAGNIGAAARAMRNMGLSKLALVAPKKFPSEEATARASGAVDVLDGAMVFSDLDSAIANSRYVIGTSARRRSVEWPSQPPREAMRDALQQSHQHLVSIVFGQEKSGLSNEELDRCHQFVRVPVMEDFSSINLAATVMIVCYELHMARYGSEALHEVVQSRVKDDNQAKANAQQMRGFYRHLYEVLNQVEFINTHPRIKLFRKLIRLYNRAQLSVDEINILRGILSATQRKTRGSGK